MTFVYIHVVVLLKKSLAFRDCKVSGLKSLESQAKLEMAMAAGSSGDGGRDGEDWSNSRDWWSSTDWRKAPWEEEEEEEEGNKDGWWQSGGWSWSDAAAKKRETTTKVA